MISKCLPDFRMIAALAIPISIQTMIQSSFCIIDEVMIGQLGEITIAAVGMVVKFVLIFNILVCSVATVASIMVSQFLGQGDHLEADRSININLIICILTALVFTAGSLLIPGELMRMYTNDLQAVSVAEKYLRIISVSFFPIAVSVSLSVMLRCENKAMLVLYIGLAGAGVNTVLNYVLIFGTQYVSRMDEIGAAVATVISAFVQMFLTVYFFIKFYSKNNLKYTFSCKLTKMSSKRYLLMLLPVIINEGLWCVGQSVFASIYAHISTEGFAAVTLISPVESLFIAAFSGLSQAGAILTGRALGEDKFAKAYSLCKQSLLSGIVLSLFLILLLLPVRRIFMDIYNVDVQIKDTGAGLLLIFCIMLPFKIYNFIGGAGVMRAGGNTKLPLIIGTCCTYLIAIPIGLVAAFVFHLSVIEVCAYICIEEVIRFIIIALVLRSKSWMLKI